MTEPTPAAETGQTDTTQPAQAAETDWKAEARKWEQRAKENKAQLDAAAPKLAEYDQWAEASKTDLERAQQETQRWQSEAERWRTDSVKAHVQALASDFADPTDAATVLSDPDKYLGAGGVIDDDAIKADLAAVLEQKPHWRRPDTTEPAGPRSPAPNRSQGVGASTSAVDPGQQFGALLNQALKRG